MKTKKWLLIIGLIVSIWLFAFNVVTYILPVSQQSIYIDKNSATYYLNESGVLTDVEIKVVNPTNKNYINKKVVLRIVDENNYPEMYTSPIYISIGAYETKIIKISQFRNVRPFLDEYTIKADTESDISICEKTFEEYIRNVKVAVAALTLVSSIACVIGLVKLTKRSKNEV